MARIRGLKLNPIDDLVRRKYPKAFREDNIHFTPSPELSRELKRQDLGAKKYYQELSQKSEEEIASLHKAELEKDRLAAQKHKEEQERQHFYNLSSADADFEYWSKMPHWSLDEAIALSFGKNPKVVYWGRIEAKFEYLSSTFGQEYSKVRELANRAKLWNKTFDPMLPSLFIKWAADNDIPFPKELADMVGKRQGNAVDWKKMYEDLVEKSTENLTTANQIIKAKNQKIEELEKSKTEAKPLQTKEKESLFKLVIAMAVEGYRYKSSAKRNDAVTDICNDLEKLEMPIDAGTIRKYLTAAKEILPQKYH